MPPAYLQRVLLFKGEEMKLIRLSKNFYDEYKTCKEILQKHSRPYIYLTVKIHDVKFAIPFRHHIKHNHAFITYGTCGLDYTKAVVISSSDYIEIGSVIVDQKDFDAIKGKERRISNGMKKYVDEYIKALKYKNNDCYKNILKYSSLQYFEKFIIK